MAEINDNHYLKDSGFSNYENTLDLPRHRWYYYKEGFSPLLVENAIEEVGLKKKEIIIDPFNGSGTTTLTASIKGYNSFGIEVNPFTCFLSEAKSKSVNPREIDHWLPIIVRGIEKGTISNLIGFSTFSHTETLEKWLFNDDILTSFEGGWKSSNNIPGYNLKKIFKLALISAAMQNCNATRDGKCLRYRDSWKQYEFDKNTFIQAFTQILNTIKKDIISEPILANTKIIHGDAREILKSLEQINNYKLCITSPPYLNTFDYTDIYRPELFLGKFVTSQQQLYNLRLRTIRSHIQAKWVLPILKDFGILYEQTTEHLNTNKEYLMHKNIPIMVQAYFEDMFNILKLLRTKADKEAQLWLVVSNSAYAGLEVPVDLIIGEVGSRAGWYLKEIVVLRYLKKRKTKFSTNITQLRESLVIFRSTK